MNCTEAKQGLERYHDGELDTERSRSLHEHLAECSECMTFSEQIDRLRSAVRDGATYFHPPTELRRWVADQASASQLTWLKRRVQMPWWKFAGALAGAAALSVAVTTATVLRSGDTVAREVVANHVRSLMVDHLADVASSDQHTVKPWFAGKLDFSPPVHDLASEGFALVGGRLDCSGARLPAPPASHQRFRVAGRQHREGRAVAGEERLQHTRLDSGRHAHVGSVGFECEGTEHFCASVGE